MRVFVNWDKTGVIYIPTEKVIKGTVSDFLDDIAGPFTALRKLETGNRFKSLTVSGYNVELSQSFSDVIRDGDRVDLEDYETWGQALFQNRYTEWHKLVCYDLKEEIKRYIYLPYCISIRHRSTL